MSDTAKNGCPSCGTKFRTGALVTEAEKRRLSQEGIIDLGEPPGVIECPSCKVHLKVVSVRMGTFFKREA